MSGPAHPANAPLDIEDAGALRVYLESVGLLDDGEPATFLVLPGGVSSRTVLVERRNCSGVVLKQSLAKLRVAVEWCSDPARIHREALGLRWVSKLAPPGSVPALLFEDPDTHVLAMEAVPEPHDNWKQLLLAGQLQDDDVTQFARWLGVTHRQSWIERCQLAHLFEDRSFFFSLRIEPYYQYSASRVPAAAAFLGDLVEATMGRKLALVHGDSSPKNVLIHAGRLVVIDYEVIHWGDPAFDLGFALTHLLSKANHLRSLRVDFGRAAKNFFREYLEEISDMPWAGDLEYYAIRHTMGCLLARVEGRSPLEYLDSTERTRQRSAVISLISCVPHHVDELVDQFLFRLESPCR